MFAPPTKASGTSRGFDGAQGLIADARPRTAVYALIIVLAAIAAYWSSFQGALVFDDDLAVAHNTTIRSLWPIGPVLSGPQDGSPVQGRPVVNLTLAVNYAFGQINPWGYHAVNLLVHILAALTLFGVVRRTLLLDPLRPRFGAAVPAGPLAAATALVWAVHPLQTESVTYVSQRAESIMGLFFLLTLYCAIRSATSSRTAPPPDGGGFRVILSAASSRPAEWSVAAVAACALGMASKEVMVGAPLMVLLYDRTLLAGSFGGAIRRRWGMYSGMAATWVLLAYLVLGAGNRNGSAGFGTAVGPIQYACTQGGVLLHYLRLCLWPHPLVLDYGWPLATTAAKMKILPGLIVTALALGATVWGLSARKAWGLAGAWFFVILAPTSSFVPIVAQAAAEHRMYLPLAAVVLLVVLTVYALGGWTVRRLVHGDVLRRRLGWGIASAAVVLVTAALGRGTAGRNHDYRSELSIWEATVSNSKDDARAYRGLGKAHMDLGRYDQAVADFDTAIRLKPNRVQTCYYNRGNAFMKLGQYPQAIRDFDEAIRLQGDYTDAYNNRGNAYLEMGRYREAIADFDRAIDLDPNCAETYNNRGNAHVHLGQYRQAIADFDTAIRLAPDCAEACNGRGNAHVKLGMYQQAIADFDEAIRLKPSYAEAYNNRGCAHGSLGQYPQAIADFDGAIRLKPSYAEAYKNRAGAHYLVKDYERAWSDVRMCRKLGAVPDPELVRLLTTASGRSE